MKVEMKGHKLGKPKLKVEKQKDIVDMTLEDFKKIPEYDGGWSDKLLFDSIIIYPADYIHDSGYKCIGIIGVEEMKPRPKFVRLGGMSDVLHIGGIADWLFRKRGSRNPSVGRLSEVPDTLSIDCLPVSGLMRMFSTSHKIEVSDYTLSSCSIRFRHRKGYVNEGEKDGENV